MCAMVPNGYQQISLISFQLLRFESGKVLHSAVRTERHQKLVLGGEDTETVYPLDGIHFESHTNCRSVLIFLRALSVALVYR